MHTARTGAIPTHVGAEVPSQPWRTAGPVGLVVGGAATLVFHVLYEVGHGPTVINEHGEVLGLTNDRWSHVSVVAAALLAVGVGGLLDVVRNRTMRVAAGLLLAGLALRSVANWWFGLYVPGELLLIAGRGVLALAILRGGRLPAWSAGAMVVATSAWLAFAAMPSTMYDTTVDVVGVAVSGADVVAGVTALAWIALGVAVHRVAGGDRR